ncbi:hypothetical protein RRG08_008166 [Elysia crispata]|uniref:Uncharacterized protein n=1 Tax=Elysia crispata TaxID=231223 RepID=A0AAE0Z587_9GAST|nr:hypothetical protein RRG08_008166 [Elysia crispata]
MCENMEGVKYQNACGTDVFLSGMGTCGKIWKECSIKRNGRTDVMGNSRKQVPDDGRNPTKRKSYQVIVICVNFNHF